MFAERVVMWEALMLEAQKSWGEALAARLPAGLSYSLGYSLETSFFVER